MTLFPLSSLTLILAFTSAFAQKGDITPPRCTTKCDLAENRRALEAPVEDQDSTFSQTCNTARGTIRVSDHSVELESGTVIPVTKTIGLNDLYQSDDGVLSLYIENPDFPGAECSTDGSPLPHPAHASICAARLVWGLREPETFSCRREW